MKNFGTLCATSLCLVLLGAAAGCKKEGGGAAVDKSPSTIVPAAATISTEPGREVNILARIEDGD